MRRRHQCRAGFTILEVLLVVAILSLLVRLVVLNAGAFIPEWQLNGEVKKLTSRISYMVAEARLQGNRFTLVFDLTNHRVRTVLPPDYGKALTDDERPPALSTAWTKLDPPLEFEYIEVGAQGKTYSEGIVEMPFTALGTTIEAAIMIKNPTMDNIQTTLVVCGISGQVEEEPGEYHLEKANEDDF